MSYPRKFKVIYRPPFDKTVLPIDKSRLEVELPAADVDCARKLFKESNPTSWIVAIVPTC